MKLVAAAAAALAVSSLSATPGWARTAYQEWMQGHGIYVSSKEHPPELSEFFEGVAAGEQGLPVAPPPYYDPYGRAVPPGGYHGAPAY